MNNPPEQPSDLFPSSEAGLAVPQSAAADNAAPSSLPPVAEAGASTKVYPVSKEQLLSASGRKDARYALYTALGYLAFLQIVMRIHNDQVGVILITTLFSLGFNLLFTVYAARALRTPRALGLTFALSALAIAPSLLARIFYPAHPEWRIWMVLDRLLTIYLMLLHRVPGVDGLLLILPAVCIGVGISRLVREFKLLLPMVVVLAGVDLYVVFGGGLVKQAEKGSPVAQHMMKALTVPMGTVKTALPMAISVGFADFLFIALFFACFAKFRIPSARTFQVLFGVLAAYMMVVFLKNIALPALVPIAVVVIGMNLRRFRFARDELFAMLYAALLCIALVVFFTFYWRFLKSRS